MASPTVEKKAKKHPLVNAMAGFCSGATEATVTMPFDTVKTYCQVQRSGISPVKAAQDIFKLKGVSGYYYGLPAVLVQVAGKGAIRWSAYEQFKHALQKANAPKASVDLLAGMGAGFAEAFLWTTPTERLKVLRQNDIRSGTNQYSSLLGSVRTVMATHGVTGLYAGIGACGLRQASGVGVRFAIYGRIKEAITSNPPQMWQSAVAGGITGCISTAVNNPLDVVKTRIEAQDGKVKEYTGTFQCIRSTVKKEGIRALYRGIAPRMLKISLGQAITFTAYEQYSEFFSGMATLLRRTLDGVPVSGVSKA